MPSETFRRLPEEKKKKIMSAIQGELLKKNISEVSINQIIKNADISRGSFYQYFEDKDDMILFIVSEFRKKIFDYLVDHMAINQGDVFLTLEDALGSMLEYAREKDDFRKMHFRLLSDWKAHEIIFTSGAKDKNVEQLLSIIRPYIGGEYSSPKEEERFRYMIDLLFDVTSATIMEVFMKVCHEEAVDDEKEKYHIKIQMIKNGFLSL